MEGESQTRESSSDEEKHALTDNDRRSSEKARNKESRWGKKEKEWMDPLLPKSNSVYKYTVYNDIQYIKPTQNTASTAYAKIKVARSTI